MSMLGRLNRDVGSLSNIGIIYADREYLGSFNRAGGLDYRARLKNRWTFTGQAVTSANQEHQQLHNGRTGVREAGLDLQRAGFYDQVSYSDLHRGAWLAYTDTGGGFVTDTGFFQRPDVREPNGG